MINKLVEKIKKTKAPIVVGMGKLWKGLQRQSGSLIKKS